MNTNHSSFEILLESGFADLPSEGIFGSQRWVQVLQAGLGKRVQILKVIEKGKLLCYLPLYVVEKGPFKKAFLPPMTPYGGPYFVSGSATPRVRPEFHKHRQLFEEVLEFLSHKFDYNLHRPEFNDIRSSQWQGWQTKVTYMLSVDLKSYKNGGVLGRRTKECIKIAQDHGLTFEASDEDELFCQGFDRIFQRKDLRVPFDSKEILKMRQKGTELGFFENFVVKDGDGNPIVYYTTIPETLQKQVTCWTISSLPESETNHGSIFMYWNLLEHYAADFEVMDMGGGDDRGVAAFKEKFATNITPYYNIETYRNSGVKWMMDGYHRLRKWF